MDYNLEINSLFPYVRELIKSADCWGKWIALDERLKITENNSCDSLTWKHCFLAFDNNGVHFNYKTVALNHRWSEAEVKVTNGYFWIEFSDMTVFFPTEEEPFNVESQFVNENVRWEQWDNHKQAKRIMKSSNDFIGYGIGRLVGGGSEKLFSLHRKKALESNPYIHNYPLDISNPAEQNNHNSFSAPNNDTEEDLVVSQMDDPSELSNEDVVSAYYEETAHRLYDDLDDRVKHDMSGAMPFADLTQDELCEEQSATEQQNETIAQEDLRCAPVSIPTGEPVPIPEPSIAIEQQQMPELPAQEVKLHEHKVGSMPVPPSATHYNKEEKQTPRENNYNNDSGNKKSGGSGKGCILYLFLSTIIVLLVVVIYMLFNSQNLLNNNNDGQMEFAEQVNTANVETQTSNAERKGYGYDEHEQEDTLTYAQRDYNGHEAVDLGLSVLWASSDLGDGEYYGWGNTNRYYTKPLSNYPCANPPASICGTAYDMARDVWGGDWRLPTKEECQELLNRCRWEVIEEKLTEMEVTGPSGKSICFYFGGYIVDDNCSKYMEWGFYWTGDIYERNKDFASNLTFDINGRKSMSGYFRYAGMKVRPVIDR